ncbi:TSC complex subunit 1a isoform X2 [Pseudoliparis swirei]|uniref:TSC complex subunit 1a isoform X2 n=1 Tax=Pseudoliparis swirei TaxID=2059687 RepID=UPI0024BDA253|nr:TSC complex subunit 1a isoform X2 [Pseudoliparis swirei]
MWAGLRVAQHGCALLGSTGLKVSNMSSLQSISELLLSLDSPELQEAEQVRAAINQQLSTDRGGAVLSSLVDYYLDSSSPQVVLLLSSIREPHHKPLLEKLNEALNRPGSRLTGLTLLGHLVRNQPPWVHHISRSALLPSLLRCLKTDSDVVVLVSGVLVLITLLPMIPQAGKQHIYDFFDVFGRLVSWSYKNPGHVLAVHMLHLHAAAYSLFHRLYGMFPCSFISYLRLHYSMKENLDAFQEVVKPMLEHVRVHPELVTGTQDYELDPSRWRCHEVHDIVIECSRVSLDPLESSCEEDMYSSIRDPPPSPLPHLNLTCSPINTESVSSSGWSVCSQLLSEGLNSSYIQADVTWSPSSQCGLSTPPPEPAATGSAPPTSRTASISGVTCPSSASFPATPLTKENQDGGHNKEQVKLVTQLESSIQPITELEGSGDVINNITENVQSSSSQPALLTSTPRREEPSPPDSLCFTPSRPSSTTQTPEGGSALSAQSSASPYELLFELALPRAAALFIGRMTQEVLQKAEKGGGVVGGGGGGGGEEEQTSISPLEVLDQLIVHGHDAHQHLGRRLSAVNKSVDRSNFGGPAQGEELQSLRSQLLLVHSQLQYERFKRQQHAVRNRRLLRRVINGTALEEHAVAMKGQLSVQDEEIRSLKSSLQDEHRRHTHLQHDAHTHTTQLHTHNQLLLLQQQDEQRDKLRLKSELQECQNRLRDLEAELQKANNKSYNAEHQLTQLSLKLCSSEQLQQQIFLLNQQLVLLRETNKALSEHLEGGHTHQDTEEAMLQCSLGHEFQRLKDSDVQQRQKLEAANHRTAELEDQLAKKDQLVLDQKKLLEDTKTQSRGELAACESRCEALRRVTQTLQTETLHLYSQIHLEAHSRPQDFRPNNASVAVPAPQGHKPRPFSSSAGIVNGAAATFSTSPLHLLCCSSSPMNLFSCSSSPLAVGSFLEQRARQLFRPTNHSQEEGDEEGEEEDGDEENEEQEEEEEEQKAQPGSPPLCQEAEILLAGSPQPEPSSRTRVHSQTSSRTSSGPPAPPADLTLAVRQRRHELSIMDYDETLHE